MLMNVFNLSWTAQDGETATSLCKLTGTVPWPRL